MDDTIESALGIGTNGMLFGQNFFTDVGLAGDICLLAECCNLWLMYQQ